MGGISSAHKGSSEVMDLGNVTWRKASYSGDNGGNCVEVGNWRKATYSGDNGGACVEVAGTPGALVAVRDSKDPVGPTLSFTPPAWRSFLTHARRVAVSDGSHRSELQNTQRSGPERGRT